MDSSRVVKAESTVLQNRKRHHEIEKVHKQLIALAQLFQDLAELVIQQEPAIQNIEQQSEQVEGNVERAVVHLEGAITSADGARKKKWICLGIAGKFSHHEAPTHRLTCYSTHHHHHCCCGGGGGLALAAEVNIPIPRLSE
jgi:SNARE domain